ncbi:MAG: PilZ domain-containing protein [Sandaracinaceae bacterium]
MPELVRPRRRRSLRRSFRTRCQAVRLDDFNEVGQRILDIDHRGALLACDRIVFPGDELVLSFLAPGGTAVIDAVGEVQRVVHGRRRGDPGYAAGIAFTEMDWDMRAELFVRLTGTPPPVPSRRPIVDYAETIRRIGLGR